MAVLDGLGIVVVCLILAVVTVMIHMLMLFILRSRVHTLAPSRNRRLRVVHETFAVSAVVVGLCAAHLAEIVAWGGGYLVIGALRDPGDAIYFSLTMYTTVGPDGLSIPSAFRGVAGFESLIGPIMVAWSTAFLVGAAGRLRETYHPDPDQAPK